MIISAAGYNLVTQFQEFISKGFAVSDNLRCIFLIFRSKSFFRAHCFSCDYVFQRIYNMVFYDVDENGFIDMEDVRKKAQEYKPQLILTGASAYSRIIDFAAFAEIAKEASSSSSTNLVPP